MYSTRQLIALELQKQVLIARSNLLRRECTDAAVSLARPLRMAEQTIFVVRRLSPLLALTSFLIPKKFIPQKGIGLVGLATKWAPTILRTLKLFRSASTPVRTTPTASS